MRTRIAAAILVISVVVLIGVGLSMRSGQDDPRADLVGSAVTNSQAAPPGATSTTVTKATGPSEERPSGGDAVVPKADVLAADVVNPPPRRLAIPAIGVDVPVTSVGLADDGSMEIPGASEAGWFRFGPHPGATAGSSVIAAHVDYDGAAGPFFNLRRLEVGDPLTVTDGAGKVRRFVVSARFQVAKDQLPVEELFRTGGAPTLSLITCGGAFNSSSRHYQDNIVVRAVPATT